MSKSATRRGIYLLPLLVGLLGACQKRTPPPIPLAAPDFLRQGEVLFEQGNLAGAAAAYQEYLSNQPSGAHADRALFRIALAYLLPESPVHDPERAEAVLEKLVGQWAASPYAGQASLILDLEKQLRQARSGLQKREVRIRELTDELEQLKAIDMRR